MTIKANARNTQIKTAKPQVQTSRHAPYVIRVTILTQSKANALLLIIIALLGQMENVQLVQKAITSMISLNASFQTHFATF